MPIGYSELCLEFDKNIDKYLIYYRYYLYHLNHLGRSQRSVIALVKSFRYYLVPVDEYDQLVNDASMMHDRSSPQAFYNENVHYLFKSKSAKELHRLRECKSV